MAIRMNLEEQLKFYLLIYKFQKKMAIDYGDKRIGLSLTDPLNIIASPFQTLKNDSEIFLNIAKICREKDVISIVIGIPSNSENKIGFSAKKVIKFMNGLIDFLNKENLKISFFEQDESFSTKEAYSTMAQIRVKNKNKKNIVDSIASANILRDFINSKKKILYDYEKYKKIIEQG